MRRNILCCKNCCGCSACYNICPQKAIVMKENSEGFLYPEIDENKCIECGLCYSVCPSINSEKLEKENTNYKEPKCYAGAANDELRKNSSSGAIFSLLAEYILSNNGYVCGAVFDENMNLNHIIINNKQNLEQLKGSKYLQSNINISYSQIKELLNNNKLVLFSGTPCQVAGLKTFLQKDYDNLLLVEIVCHGVPSPKVYHKYLDENFNNKQNEKVLNTNFRDKLNGWNPYLITTTTTTNTYVSYASEDIFMRAFLENLCLRDSCSKCQFKVLPKYSDITIGDFWEVEKYDANLNDKKGTSVILINNKKGEKYLDLIKNNLTIFKETPLNIAYNGNLCLYDSIKPHKNRKKFFNQLDILSLKENVDICLKDKCDCIIMNFWFGNNYGAILTCYALQEQLKLLKKDTKIVFYLMNDYYKKQFSNNISDIFAKKYFNLTDRCDNLNDLKKLNELTETFIVGSDQVWRHIYNNGDNKFYLNFVKSNKKKIAYAVSFGTDSFEGNEEETELAKFYINNFDYISVREKDGTDICKNTFNVNAAWVLDPVFLLDSNYYDELINNCQNKRNDTDYICSYILDQSKIANTLLDKIKNVYKKDNIFNMIDGSKQNIKISVEEWLYNIKNCKLLLTDSFHGVCFAIIFNKPFICLANINRGYSRFKSILELLGLKKQLVVNDKNFGNVP